MKTKKWTALVLSVLIMAASSLSSMAASFVDVQDNYPYKTAVDFCQAKGYVKGTGSDAFRPDAKLTRGEMAVIWCRFLKIKDTNHGFSDITQLKDFYEMPTIVLYSLGILSGTTDTRFSPEEFVSREQIALITKRIFNLGVANSNAYMEYDDYERISSWARDGISASLNADVFEGLYDGSSLNPSQAVTRGELCKLIYNMSMPSFSIRVGTLTGGTITANRTKARAGTTIVLTITPDSGKQLKAGTLKYGNEVIDGNSFTMPSKNVLITAEFENKPVVLEALAVTSPPAKTVYAKGETLDLSGLVVSATLSDGTVTHVTQYTTSPAAGTVLNTAGAIHISISYTQGSITKTAGFNVEVTQEDSE